MKAVFSTQFLIILLAAILTSAASSTYVTQMAISESFLVNKRGTDDVKVSLSLDEDDEAFMFMKNNKGKYIVMHGSSIAFHDEHEQIRLLLGVNDQGQPYIVSRDEQGNIFKPVWTE